MPNTEYRPITKAQFRKLSPEKQRIAIARDVIALCQDTSNFRVEKSSYFDFDVPFDKEKRFGGSITAYLRSLSSDKIQKFFRRKNTATQHCHVCGIGSCFVSAIRLNDHISGDELVKSMGAEDGIEQQRQFIADKLSPWFSPQQLALIECAFEKSSGFGWHGGNMHGDWRLEVYRAEYFGIENYSYDPRRRLIAIMLNLIANKGEFRP